MELNFDKADRQKKSAIRWRDSGGKGCLHLTPRFGKTFLSIEYIINPYLAANRESICVIITPSEAILLNWKDNLESYCEYNDRVHLVTINYLVINNIESECGLLVVDELHKFTTSDYLSYIIGDKIKHKFRLGLTGTYPFDNKVIKEYYPIVDTITEKEAIENCWIAPFIEYNILLNLHPADKEKYVIYSARINEIIYSFKDLHKLFVREANRLMFEGEFDLICACHSGFKTTSLTGEDMYITYDRLCNTLSTMLGWNINLNIAEEKNKILHENWSPIAIHAKAKTFMEYIRLRNDILIDNDVKLEAVLKIIEYNKTSTICFNESTKFADKIADAINLKFEDYNAVCYHSNIDSRSMIDPETGRPFTYKAGDRAGLPKILGKTSIKKLIIEWSRKGYYKFISTAKALDEGIDIPIIDQIICTAGTTNPITYQQRTARGKTIDIYNPNKLTKIFNLVFDDFDNNGEIIKSRDKSKLMLRQKKSANIVTWIKSIEDLKNIEN